MLCIQAIRWHHMAQRRITLTSSEERKGSTERRALLPSAFSLVCASWGSVASTEQRLFQRQHDTPIRLVKNHSPPVLCQAWGAKISPAYSKWHSKRKAGLRNFHLSLDVFSFPPMLTQAAAAWLVHLCSNYRKNLCRRAGVQQPAQGLSLHFSPWKSSSHPSLPCLWSNVKPMPSALVAKNPFPSRCKVGSASWGWGTSFR